MLYDLFIELAKRLRLVYRLVFLSVDVDFYSRAYKDLTHFTESELFEHWKVFGAREGRIPNKRVLGKQFRKLGVELFDFDGDAYLLLHRDLYDAGLALPEQGAVHFVTSGFNEGRAFSFELPDELKPEKESFIVANIAASKDSSEAVWATEIESLLRRIDPSDLILGAFLVYFDELPDVVVFDHWLGVLDSHRFRRSWVLREIKFSGETYLRQKHNHAALRLDAIADKLDAGEIISFMGEPIMSEYKWFQKALELVLLRETSHDTHVMREGKLKQNHLIDANGKYAASVIISLFNSESRLDKLFTNLESQTVFKALEIILILVSPSEIELEKCEEFLQRNNNVKLSVHKDRVGIYAAWNEAIELSSSDLLTNMNADDLRRCDSLETQISIMQSFDWIDVLYQDVIISLNEDLTWDEIEQIGAISRFPFASLRAFLSGYNPPHNGPMWRRTLHKEFGFFDEKFISAGDYDFWIRCKAGGACFYGISDAHVGYFINPNGLSTRRDGAGIQEISAIRHRYKHLYLDQSHNHEFQENEGLEAKGTRYEKYLLETISSIRAYRQSIGGVY